MTNDDLNKLQSAGAIVSDNAVNVTDVPEPDVERAQAWLDGRVCKTCDGHETIVSWDSLGVASLVACPACEQLDQRGSDKHVGE